MGRKWLLTLLVGIMLVLHLPIQDVQAEEKTTGLDDISGHWAEQAISELYKQGIVKGKEDGKFYPDQPITRAELVTLFLKAKGITPYQGSQTIFADISLQSWLHPFATTAYRLGIVNGSPRQGNLYFDQQQTVERQEFITLLLRAKGDSGRVNQLRWSTTIQTLNKYPDTHEIDSWGQREFAYALNKNIATPTDDQLLEPTKLVTRAEAANYTYENIVAPRLAYSRTEKPVPFQYKRQLTVQTTAYTGSVNVEKSFIGAPLRVGTVAVDPNVIALGSHLYIEGYGYAIAADIGGAVKNNHVDVFLPSLEAAKAYGRQKDTKVYVLD
ncbi:S-layer homology domain-containing protein [Brevibacillus sp. SYSU BS000544]|uniref:S-layer homology domain-containing protein n=1 Tax=Brevibacillus sp. SYSU BS000544 TaxID=3416443 RepID=UPI003CE550DC